MGSLNDIWPAPTPEELRQLSVMLTRAHYAALDLSVIRGDERASRAFDALRSLVYDGDEEEGPELDEAVRVLERLAVRSKDRKLTAYRRECGDPTLPAEQPAKVVRLDGLDPSPKTTRRKAKR